LQTKYHLFIIRMKEMFKFVKKNVTAKLNLSILKSFC